MALTGGYLADVELPPDALEVAFVRSPYAHAAIDGIRGGRSLGLERTRYTGEAVAMTWGADRAAAEDAADAVEVDWRPLPLEPGVARFESNFDSGGVDEAFAGAAHVFEETYTAARQTPLPLETRGVIAWPRGDRLELWTSTQVPHMVRRHVAEAIGVDEQVIRVLVPRVGGGFGLKANVFAEEIALAAAARETGRVLRWVEDRRENLLASAHAHDIEVRLRLAVAADGNFLAVEARVTADVGAAGITDFTTSLYPATCAQTLFGPYALPAYRFAAQGISSHRCPVGPYRGVGMNAAVHATERMVDEVAAALGIDPLELRRRNAHPRTPVTSVVGRPLDSGDYPRLLDELSARSGYPQLLRERDAARAAGRLFGIGIGFFNEHSGTGSADYRRRGVTSIPGLDAARIQVTAEGRLLISTSAAEAGQGHAETYRLLATRELGILPEQVDVVEGDTDLAPFGSGTFASRGAVGVTEAVVRCLRQVAAVDMAPGTDVVETVDPVQVFPSGAHLAVAEVDPVTLVARVTRYVAVEDAGTILHPELADAQVRGGVAMGIGNVLLEEHVYTEDGQLQTATLLDYLVPLATDVPAVEIHHLESPSPHTTVGSKGIGEAGTVGAFGAVANAVADAVRSQGIKLTRLPYSPQRIFESGEKVTPPPG
ncbi:MAG TPA: molybdopterin cofactor-binding domain-containing protein [Candidatus Dormibacteraeota bacterium]